jgi:hypothetical protein
MEALGSVSWSFGDMSQFNPLSASPILPTGEKLGHWAFQLVGDALADANFLVLGSKFVIFKKN